MRYLNTSTKSDDIQLLAISAYLRHTYNIPEKQIKKDWFVLINPKNYKIFGVTKAVLPKMVQNDTIIHSPDIIILDKHFKLQCMMELDGYSHKTPYGLKRTAKRNRNYLRTLMPFVVIDIDELKRAKQNWFEYIDESLNKLGILDLVSTVNPFQI